MPTSSVRLVLAGSGRRRDLSVPVDATVREVLTSSGVDPSRMGVMSAGGDLLDLDEAVGERMRDGSLLWLFDGDAAAASARAAAAAQRDARRAASPHVGVQAAGLAAVAAAVTAAALIDPSGLGAIVAAGVLGLGALALLLHPSTAEADLPAMLAPVVAFAAGAAAAASTGFPGAVVAVGAVSAATAACVRHGVARLRGQRVQPVTGISAALWVFVALVLSLSFVTEMPAVVAPALLLGTAAPLFRALTSIATTVEDEDLLDMPYLIRDAPGVRTAPSRSPRPVRRRAVERSFAESWRRCDAAATLLSATVAVSAVVLMLLAPSGTVAGWCLVGGTGGVGAFLVLAARGLRAGVTKSAARLGGVTALVAVAVHLSATLPFTPLLSALALLVLGAGVAATILPTAKGWRSLGWSRTGDIVEGTLIALAPAALLYGSGVVEALMRGLG
ncbi:hypothetical protein [Microbacterium marinilacus]|uniref:hypothetical protein n=1 Tax=Microbacterium marinilacus TaxID=415209 RepID=UPI001C8DC8A8|nr:hypothetical protein [Microbacterium marinilacus]MBY0689516.1 hypothetical protein [Microbacterium marinilacus]